MSTDYTDITIALRTRAEAAYDRMQELEAVVEGWRRGSPGWRTAMLDLRAARREWQRAELRSRRAEAQQALAAAGAESQCAECGHLHFDARLRAYGVCPIRGCGCPMGGMDLREELLLRAAGVPLAAAALLAQGLAEGDPANFKAGYTPVNAVLAAADYFGIPGVLVAKAAGWEAEWLAWEADVLADGR